MVADSLNKNVKELEKMVEEEKNNNIQLHAEAVREINYGNDQIKKLNATINEF
jgi:wyosine [tRNA(Phe)-imidazoG37] synthetase (radical SAM superfamily)